MSRKQGTEARKLDLQSFIIDYVDYSLFVSPEPCVLYLVSSTFLPSCKRELFILSYEQV